jgi:hypothetical protein
MDNQLDFKSFLESSFMTDVKKTVLKIPASHRNLVKGYKYKAEGGNTLSRDNKHVGEIDEKKKLIRVAAPWNYGREFTILHEIAHAVYKYFVNEKLRRDWSALLKKTKAKSKEIRKYLDQDDEEIFCMIYAQHYTKNGMVKFEHPELEAFIEKLPS